MRIRLKLYHRFLAGMLTVMFIPLLLSGWFAIRYSEPELEKKAINMLLFSVEKEAIRLRQTIAILKTDTLLLEEDTALKQYVEARGNGDSPGTRPFREEVERQFLHIARLRGIYHQVRYIDETGREAVRIERDQSALLFSPAPVGALQDKKIRDYFRLAMNISPGEVWASRLELNREGTPPAIKTPLQPVFRYSTPVVDSRGEKRGIVVTNVDFLALIEDLQKEKDGKIFLVDSRGYYLRHPDPSKEWGAPEDFNTGWNFQNDYPKETSSHLFSDESGWGGLGDEVYAFSSIRYGDQPQDFWVVFHVIPKDRILGPLQRYRHMFYGIMFLGFFAGIGTAVFLSRRITRPVQELQRMTASIAEGNLSESALESYSSNDEIGQLGADFETMRRKIQECQDGLKEQVAERTWELSLLLKFSEMISSSLRLDEMLAGMTRMATHSLEVSYAYLCLLDPKTNQWTLEGSYARRPSGWNIGQQFAFPRDGETLPLFQETLKRGRAAVFPTGKYLKTERPDNVELWNPWTTQLLLVPIIHKGKPLAILALGEERSPDRTSFTTEKINLCQSLAHHLAAGIESIRLYSDLEKLAEGLVKAMASSIDKKSPWTAGHSERVAGYAVGIATRQGLDDRQVDRVRIGGLLHDIGKIGVPEAILDKPGALGPEEVAAIREHPDHGAEILGHLEHFEDIIEGIRYHHENYDGTGYPEGCRGTAIPLMGRILAVADAFDSMTAARPYRLRPAMEYAISELRRCSGTQFDPEVVSAFLEILPQIKKRESAGAENAGE